MRERDDVRGWLDWAGAEMRRYTGDSNAEVIAELLGVAPRTVRAWHQANDAPRWAVRVLLMLTTGLAPHAASSWPGWRFVRDGSRSLLAGPDGSTWTPDCLMRYRDTADHLRCLQERVQPGAQLSWSAPGSGRRNVWPGGVVPAWAQLEDALRGVVQDELRRRY